MFWFLIVTCGLCAVAACTDLRAGRIPNWLTFSGALGGLLGHGLFGYRDAGLNAGLESMLYSVCGAVFCGLVPGLLYWKGGLGGGDFKLFIAIGSLCHPLLGTEVQLYGLIVAAVFAPARLAYQGRLLRVLSGSLSLALNPFLPSRKRRPMPTEVLATFRLGPAILAGSLLCLLSHGYSVMPR